MLILASASPRRKELISLISKEVKIYPADVDESFDSSFDAETVPEMLSVRKAKAVAELFPEDTVIGSDTSVIIDGKILGKPKDEEDAKNMLRLLSGNTHKVITGCAIFKNGRSLSFSETTEVIFYPLTEKEISDYVLTREPMDKAGAYGIQGYGSLLIKEIKGDYFNVVGLPVSKLSRILKRI